MYQDHPRTELLEYMIRMNEKLSQLYYVECQQDMNYNSINQY